MYVNKEIFMEYCRTLININLKTYYLVQPIDFHSSKVVLDLLLIQTLLQN